VARLIYGSNEGFEFDERTLAHLKIAITAKLRVRESFLLNWVIPAEKGSGRMSIWLSPEVPLTFVFHGSKPPQLNKIWIDALSRSAHGIRGMTVMAENEAEAYLRAAGTPAAP
jgi:hypothetical protein